MTMLAAFKVLLYRYTGERDVVVGTPIANRNRREIEGLIGFFINTLVLRTGMAGEEGFGEVLARVKEVSLGAYAHQDVPFEKLVEELQPERDTSRTPLFQVMFVLQNTPMPSMKMGELKLSPFLVEGTTSKFDLTLSVMEDTGDSLTAWLEYNTDLFDEHSMERMATHYETLLRSIVANPDERISQLSILTAAEKQQLLGAWNDTASTYTLERCMHTRFEEQVERSPHATALIYETQELTYAELNRRANRFAHRLHEKGVGTEVLVGILMERSVEMVVSLLGVLKTGGAYVPLDPGYPKDRIAFMVEDAGVKVLLTQQDFLEDVSRDQLDVVCLDAEGKLCGETAEASLAESENPAIRVDVDNTAYVIYTSGSTGRPKGVMTSHRAMSNCASFGCSTRSL